ncbi:precorrin-6A reductase [Pseudoflavonifractor phocaeensis]|uniref:precorrin-6A reductase n=1 Tax=Pseudoflavonifractor phocaeensis TaxID=1870988 RepID=UPI00195C1646|nr:precorrin-6A reductase [Pseudoflavonifractor phocaeensis]MBM6869454.1 precorrin-6A reductase [Pseudoflavonifractor phocaeensis]
MEVLIFGGTAEGRILAEWLVRRGDRPTVCVATEYGAELMTPCPGLTVHAGRMEQGEMEGRMEARPFSCVIDATHPYAVAVTENIKRAAAAVGLPYYRLLRSSDGEDLCHKAEDMATAARMLHKLPGNVLLTTGSKELHQFAQPGLVERCYPRVLPTVESLERCLALGFPPAHVICMQGPFSRALNEAMLRQFHIRTLVTKDSGSYGGFREKADAAAACGCALLVVERPRREAGLDLERCKELLRRKQA